jgi:dTDP-4-dehydrorhamnose reductase
MITGTGVFTSNWILNNNKFDYKSFVVSKSKRRNFPTKIYLADLINIEQAQLIIKKLKPDVIVNSAAMTNIEKCELYPREAYETNCLIPKNLAKICKKNNILLVQISTDNFKSGKGVIRNEKVLPEAVNEYGRTKLLGEREIVESGARHIIIRTNFFAFAPGFKSTFVDKIIRNLQHEVEVKGFVDYTFNPVSIDYLVEVVLKLIYLEVTGLINIASDYCTTKYDFALLIAEKFNLDKNFIRKSTRIESFDLIQRPNNLCLDNLQMKRILSLLSLNLGDQIDILKRDYETKYDILKKIK